MPSRKADLVPDSLEPLILVIRNQRVILDADLARLYGVSTKRFNEAFKRNQQRFPDDFAFQLTIAEFNNLRSQVATSSLQHVESTEVLPKRSQIVTTSHGGRRYRPWAFTEHGAVMAANILHSERAIHMSVFVVRAFVRQYIAANRTILKRLAEIDKTLLEQHTALIDLYGTAAAATASPPTHPSDGSDFSRRGNRDGNLPADFRHPLCSSYEVVTSNVPATFSQH